MTQKAERRWLRMQLVFTVSDGDVFRLEHIASIIAEYYEENVVASTEKHYALIYGDQERILVGDEITKDRIAGDLGNELRITIGAKGSERVLRELIRKFAQTMIQCAQKHGYDNILIGRGDNKYPLEDCCFIGPQDLLTIRPSHFLSDVPCTQALASAN